MPAYDREKVDRLKQILKWHPRGITITDLAAKIEMNRNLVAKYLDILLISGQVEMQVIGAAKVFFLSHRVPISSMLEYSSDMVIILDSNQTIIQVNEPLLVQIHEKKETLVGRNIQDIDHPFLSAIPVIPPSESTDPASDQVRDFECIFGGQRHYYKFKQLQTAFEDGSQGITLIIEDVTAQITYQKMLELNEAKYRGIVEDQTEFITRFLPDGTLVFINDAYARYLGKEKVELLGQQHIPDIDDQDIPAMRQCIQSLDLNNPVQSCECSIHHSSGKKRSNLWTIRAIFDDTQKPIEYQGVGRDNTEKREAATRINQYIRDMEFLSRKSQEFVEISADADIFQAIAQGLSEIIPGSLITVNSIDTASDSLTIRAVLPDRDRETFKKYLGKDLLGFLFNFHTLPEEKRSDFLSTQLAGKLVQVKENLYTVFFHQIPQDTCDMIQKNLNLGDSIYSIGLTRHGRLFGNVAFSPRKGENITNPSIIETFIRQSSIVLHRRLTDEALKTSESRYRAIVEDQTEFITRFLPDGTLVFVNDAYARYLGKKKEDLIGGQHIPEIDCDDKTRVNLHIQSLDIQNPVQSFECRIHHPCGKIRSNLWTVRALFDKTQKIIEFQGVGRDNTEKREAATKISQYIRDWEFLSRKSQEFVELSSEADIFNIIGQGLSELLPNAVITVNAYDSLSDIITNKAVFSEHDQQILSSCIGKEFLGFRFPLQKVPASLRTPALNELMKGKLFPNDESLYNLLFQQVPVDICDKIKENLNLGDKYYGIGIVRHDILFGIVTFALRKGDTIRNSSLIETYIHQASIVLHRRVFEDALRKSESQYRGIVEDQTEFITRFLPDGVLTFVNDSVCRYFQKERHELLGRSIFSLIPQDDKHHLIPNLQSLNAQNPVRTVEHRVYDSSGRTRWTQWTNRALFDDSGTIIEYQGVGRDITEQKEADAKIRQYIAEREFLMQTALSFMDLKDDENFYQYIADQVHAIVPGQVIAVASIQEDERTITLESIAGLDAAVIEEFRKLGVSLFGKSFSLDKDPGVEATLQRKNLTEGPRLYNLLFREFPEEICTHLENLMGFGKSYVTGFIHEGKIFGSVIIILRPGQELKNKETLQLFLNQVSVALLHNHARQELKAREKLYRSVIENIQDVFYRSDKEGNLIMASGGWAKMFGYDSLEECIGSNIAEKFYFEPERRKEVLETIYKNGSVSDYEIVLKSRDGSPVYVSTTSHPYFDDEGEVLGVEGILHDISERHAAAEKLRSNLSQMEFFSRKIQEFIELPPDSDIYYAIGQGLKELLPDSMIIVNTYARNTGTLTIKALIGDKARATALKNFQSDLTGVSLQVDEQIPENILEGKIYPVRKNFYSILSCNFSQEVSTAIMQELNLGNFYYFCLTWKGSFLGNVAFGLPKGEQLEKTEFIELYGKAASLALQRKIAEDSLKGSSCTLPPGPSILLRGEEHAFFSHAKNASSETNVPVPVPDAGNKYSPDQGKIKIPGIVEQLNLNNALKMARDYIAILDLAGNCLWANDAMVSALDTGDHRELAGRNLALYIAPEFRKMALTSLVEAKKKGHKTVPLMLFSASGRVPVEVNLSTIHAEDGNISGFLAIARNTDRATAEKQK